MPLKLLCSALLLYLSFPNALSQWGFWICGWLFTLPLFSVLDKENIWRRMLAGLLFGLISGGMLLTWMLDVHIYGYVLFVCVMSIQPVLFAAGFRKFQKPWLDLTYCAFLWVASEWIRSAVLGGFTWSLGYSQSFRPELIQTAALFGSGSVAFILIFVGYGFYRTWQTSASESFYWKAALVIILITWGWGELNLSFSRIFDQGAAAVRICTIQPNIPPKQKWDESSFDENVRKHLMLTKEGAHKTYPELIVWPETAFPDDLLMDRTWYPRIRQLARQNYRTNFLIGTALLIDDKDFNSAVFINAQGIQTETYHKQFLVPFAEFSPWGYDGNRFWKRFHLEGVRFTPGDRLGLMHIEKPDGPVRFGVAICSEACYPKLYRKLKKSGPVWIVSMLNDGWFKQRSGIMQHALNDIFRAVETRTPIIRATNTGWTTMISPYGQIDWRKSLPLNEEGFTLFDLQPQKRYSLYAQIGDIFAVAGCLFVIMTLLISLLKNKT